MRRLRYAVLVLVAALALPSPAAHASPRKHGAPAVSAQDEARELYKKGMTHYELGQFDDAIAAFKRAYELTSAPGLLFNLAQVYRMKKDAEQALYFYKTYLRLIPDASNRADVEALIAENQKLVDDAAAERQRAAEAQAATAAAAATPPAVTPPTVAPPTPARRRPWRIELWTGVGSAALGVGALATAIALGARSSSDANQISSANAQGDVPWDAQQQQRYRDGQNSATAATATYIVGGVLTAAGAALIALGLHDRSRARSFAVAPAPHGVVLGAACAF